MCVSVTACRHGVLIRGSPVIESLRGITSVAVDKTGTLTKGFFKVNSKVCVGPNSDSNADRDLDPLLLAASVESRSTHPLSHAVGPYCCDPDPRTSSSHRMYMCMRGAVSAQVGCIAEMDEAALLAVQKMQVLEGVGVSGYVFVPAVDDWRYVIVGQQ